MDNQRLLDRIRYLADRPIDELRSTYTAAAGITTSSRTDDRGQTRGMSRGELLAGIIAAEFFEDETE